jgi:SAM-dependent methyltransferase
MPSLGREHLSQKDSLAIEAYRERLLSAFALTPVSDKRALDLGCGDGLEAVYLARLGYSVDALDLEAHPAWDALSETWKGKLNFRTADVSDLGKLHEEYDLVFEKDMLHHVEQPLAVLQEMRRLLKSGGRLLVAECNRYNPILYLHLTLMGNHQHFSWTQLRSLLDRSNLGDAKIRRREARVWPIESVAFQRLVNSVQEIVERLKIFSPWLCYNLVSWTRADA